MSSSDSVMLCFVQTYEGRDTTKDGLHNNNNNNNNNNNILGKDCKENKLRMVKNKILRKSRSSGNFGSAGGPRSAPGTPHGASVSGHMPPIAATAATILGSESGSSPPNSLPKSPSHTVFSKQDKGYIKQFSNSVPIMTAQSQSPDPPSPKPTAKEGKPLPHKARQKKFHRHFPAATAENVLNYYSCALIGDILLQGHLYITKKYFAFYSNVFGYVTKLLIPMQSVEDITKEKTAKIIPNAVGIRTSEEKHVFGSLMSRESTYRFMTKVWEEFKTSEKEIAESEEAERLLQQDIDFPADGSESSETRDESGRDSDTGLTRPRKSLLVKSSAEILTENSDSKSEKSCNGGGAYMKLTNWSRQNLLLFITTFILILLFLSATILLYRISKVQHRYTQALQDNFVLTDNEDVYGELLQWQTHLHSKSAGAVHSFLDTNLDQIAKVRQSLEALSTLLIPKSHSASQSTATNPMDSSENS